MAHPFDAGSMFVGCNYWASHAGTNMWKDWDEAAVRRDFARLSSAGIRYLRVFPLWSDFQPLRAHLGGAGQVREVRMGEEPLPPTDEGRAGVDPVMAERFARFLDAAHECGMSLIVGLLTGWMSGRLHVPEMLQGRNVLEDPFAIRWEIRFVRYMVRRFRGHPAILAWDLGNECNCMGKIESADSFYLWTAAISGAVRSEDRSHPLISGMHGMRPETNQLPEDQGELTDIVCTHPYPRFTPHCDTDPLTGMKSALHAAAETRMYAGLAGKPCFVEEAGTLGAMYASDDNAADYLRAMLLSAWRYDCLGLMWWCAFDQGHLSHTPYDWNAVERELGLFTPDGEKPVARVMREFDLFVRRQPSGSLPQRESDAVCILTRGQDAWAAAYGSFLLACRCGVDLRFAWCGGEIPSSPAYVLPSLRGDACVSRSVLASLLQRVEEGAALYLSLDDAVLSPFEAFTGMRVEYRMRPPRPVSYDLEGSRFELPLECKAVLESTRAQVLASDGDGDPFICACAYGKGRVFLVNAPVERFAAQLPGVTDGPRRLPLDAVWRMAGLRRAGYVFDTRDAAAGFSEYRTEGGVLLFAQNYSEQDREIAFTLSRGLRVLSSDSPSGRAKVTGLEAEKLAVFIPRHDGCIARFEYA